MLMLFPLPLVPFESYMLADDRPAYPMNCFARIRFHGRLDRAALSSAMSVAVSRHPPLSAVVRRSGNQDVRVAVDQSGDPTAHPDPAIRWKSSEVAAAGL